MNDRIYRTREDRMFLGVLGGFSLRFGIDPSIVRIGYAIVTLITGIVPLVIVYFVMAIVIPEAPPGYEAAARAAVGTVPPPWATPAPPPPPSAWPPAESSVPPTGWGAQAPPVGSTPAPASEPASAPGPAPAYAPEPVPGTDATAGGVGFAAIPPATAAFTAAGPSTPGRSTPGPSGPWPPTAGPTAGFTPTSPPTPGPTPGWGAGWDASGRPVSGETDQHARDARTGAIVGGLVLVGLGGAFLLAQVAPQVDWGIVGPALLIVLGVVLVIASFRRS